MTPEEMAKKIHSNVWEELNSDKNLNMPVLDLVTGIIAKGIEEAMYLAKQDAYLKCENAANEYIKIYMAQGLNSSQENLDYWKGALKSASNILQGIRDLKLGRGDKGEI